MSAPLLTENTSEDYSFQKWMEQVDEAVLAKAEVSVHDLPDYAFRDAFDNGEDPDEVADQALAEAGYEDSGE